MLVIDSVFQHFALLDDGTIAIEMLSTSCSPPMLTDTLDMFHTFWDNIPNTMLIPSSDSSILKYLKPSQKRYIRFFRSMYYLGACTDIPSLINRPKQSIPRPLQRPPELVQGGWASILTTFGLGIPTPVAQPLCKSTASLSVSVSDVMLASEEEGMGGPRPDDAEFGEGYGSYCIIQGEDKANLRGWDGAGQDGDGTRSGGHGDNTTGL
ncbi:hypothetical protein FRB95_004961 [Tulasnella sp. JGI-2019a]|nr:hypothetical protein FRB95_004961 [Tulasnella sp. JGI-2019a]